MTFLTAGLAAGVALAAIPLILHLVMRQTPKRVIFPALQLIRQRHKRSTKRLRVKNWLLLLARMALLALMALALARPRFYSKTAMGDSEVPTALGLVFDTSPSMGYKEQGRDRLAQAKQFAKEILKKAPEDSQVFVFDSSKPADAPPAMSPAAATKRVDDLALHAVTYPLNGAVGQAYKAVAAAEKPRREVYILSDLARSAWEPGRPIENLKRAREVKPEVATYVMRLGAKDVHNAGIVDAEARPAAGVATQGSVVELRAAIRSSGPASRRVVEFYLDGEKDGTKRDQKAVDLPPGGEAEVRFRTPKLPLGLHRARLKLAGGADPLAFDDERFLTFRVRPALRVLVVSDDPARDAVFVKNALDPDALPKDEPRPYTVEVATTGKFSTDVKTPLKEYACIFLLNVKRLEDADWGRLNGYVREGGGLVVAPGHRAEVADYNGEAATPLLPATLGEVKAPAGGTAFGRADFSHPLFRRSPKDLDADLTQVPVAKYFSATPAAGSRAILSYQDGAPALLERAFPGGRTGRVLLWTTPLARRPAPNDPAAWNEFPVGRYWSFVEVMDQSVPYLAGAAGDRLNFEAGEVVSLPIDPSKRFANYVVKGPSEAATSERLSPTANSTSLEIEPPQELGQWSVLASGADGQQATLGFSVNGAPAEAQLEPIDPKDLDTLFEGKDRYQVVDGLDDLKRIETLTRVGHELFPWLMILLLLIVTAENLLANRFHKERGAG